MPTQKKYLVTGGTGFIGSALVKRLVEEGYTVRILDNNSRGCLKYLGKSAQKVEIVEADITDPKAVLEACEDVQRVYHLAFINGTQFFYSKPEHVLDVGVKGMLNVLDACMKKKIKELLLMSSSEVYQTPLQIPTDETVSLSIPNPFNPRYSYGGAKIISELLAIHYGQKYFDHVIIVRPHNVYGPQMGWEHVIPQFIVRMKELCKNNPSTQVEFPIQGSGNQTRAFIYIDDFIEGLMHAMEKGNHLNIYHIGTMEEIPISHIAQEIGNYFKKDVKIIPGQEAKGGTLRRCPDISKLKTLGFNPKISLSEGIYKTAQWYDQNERSLS